MHHATFNPFQVGAGNDYVGQESSGQLISVANGYVSGMSGFTSEYDSGFGCYSVLGQSNNQCSNTYTIQANTNAFTTTVNGQTGTGWQQFVFANNGISNTGEILIQYWLFGWLNNHAQCPPANPNLSRQWAPDGSNDCFADSPAMSSSTMFVTPSLLPVAALEGAAKCSGCGSNDENIFCNQYNCWTVSVTDSIIGLASQWTYTEWNVFGWGYGDQANFNSGTSITISVNLYDSSSNPISLYCGFPTTQGYTAETNNLNLGVCSVPSYPGYYSFGES